MDEGSTYDKWNFAGQGQLKWEFTVRNLSCDDAAETLDRIEAGEVARCVLPWVPLMRGGGDLALAARWRGIADAETPEVRGRFKAWALVFASAVDRDSMWEVALEGWNVEEPNIVYRWRDAGVAIGEQRANERAVRELRAKVVRLLNKKFGAEAAAEAARLIETADSDTVSRWFDLAIDADDWPTLRAAWGAS